MENRFGKIIYQKDKSVLGDALPPKNIVDMPVTISNSDKYLLSNVKNLVRDRFNEIYKAGEKEMLKLKDPFFKLANSHNPSSDQRRRFEALVKRCITSEMDTIHEIDQMFMNEYIEKAKKAITDKDDLKRFDFLLKNYLRYNKHCLGLALGEILPKYRTEMFIEMYVQNKDKIYTEIKHNTKKTLIFSQFKEVVKYIYHDLNDNEIGTVMITGDVTNRMEILQEFKYNDSVRVLVATSQTIGTGVTLVEANRMFFFGPPWRYADFEQCTDRIHRIGQTDEVYIKSVVLDTGKAPNLSTRMDNILKWSKQMTDSLSTDSGDANIDSTDFKEILGAYESSTNIDELLCNKESNQLNVYKEMNPKYLDVFLKYRESLAGNIIVEACQTIPANYILEKKSVVSPIITDGALENLSFSKLGNTVFTNSETKPAPIRFEHFTENGEDFWSIITSRVIRAGERLYYNAKDEEPSFVTGSKM